MLGLKTAPSKAVRKALEPGRDFALASKTLALEVNRMNQERQMQTLLLASAYPGDGRTLITATLGLALVDLGLRVTLVESSLNSTSLLDNIVRCRNAGPLNPAEDGSVAPAPGLTVVPAASLPVHYPDPEEMGLLLGRLRQRADVVLLDSAPCLSAPHAYVLAPLVDGAIYVVRRRQQDVLAQRAVVARLERFGAQVVGTLYNEKELR